LMADSKSMCILVAQLDVPSGSVTLPVGFKINNTHKLYYTIHSTYTHYIHVLRSHTTT
jgi:hypothetical protein